MSSTKLTIDNVSQSIIGIDARVPLLDGSSSTYINFDNAASTPVLKPVFDTVNQFMTWYSSVHRGTGFKSQIASRAYEEAHEIVAEWVGADPDEHTVIFGKNTTEAINKLARRFPLQQDDVVLCSLMEHHSNDLPWRPRATLVHIPADTQGALDEAAFDNLLERYAGRVRLVAITGASNITGYLPPIDRLAEKAHAAGARILVDAAQLAPHRKIAMRHLSDPGHLDYLVLSAHKMYAPYGTGALIGRRDTFEQGDPDMVGGGTVDIVTLDSVAWAGLPDKEEAGSPNVIGAVALARAALCLQEVGMDALAEHEAQLTAYTLRRLTDIPGVQVFGSARPEEAGDRLGVISFSVEGMDHYLTAAILSFEAGIGVRNGCFCAHPYILHLLGCTPELAHQHQAEIRAGDRSQLPGLVRVSFGCYNSVAEVDVLIETLGRIARREYRGTYVQNRASGAYLPVGFEPDLRAYFDLRQTG